MRLEIINDSPDDLPGTDAAGYARGDAAVDVGAWFADGPPRVVGAFQSQMRLVTPVPAGRSIQVVLEIRPMRPGHQFLCFGLWQSRIHTRTNGPIGELRALPVEVGFAQPVDRYKPVILRTIIAAHAAAFALSLLLVTRNPRRP